MILVHNDNMYIYTTSHRIHVMTLSLPASEEQIVLVSAVLSFPEAAAAAEREAGQLQKYSSVWRWIM